MYDNGAQNDLERRVSKLEDKVRTLLIDLAKAKAKGEQVLQALGLVRNSAGG